ncbi:MAG TPA: hypothetical protein VFQ84_06225 [Arenimonas sp.]|uniref:hypothetical protein n=1 Tax=Arenimonas sp. TaxID=1872635 RepID=UPI002D7E58ED|nr:hypothetical protein [Arenimonas sp.]HEU0152923.1 hypothetical protein [Arenimonas sp.]
MALMKTFHGLAVTLLLCAGHASARDFDRPLVPDKETAIGLAHVILQAYQGEEAFNRLLSIRELDAYDDGDAWTVCHCQGAGDVSELHADSITLEMPIGLEVRISKRNAEVLEINLAR